MFMRLFLGGLLCIGLLGCPPTKPKPLLGPPVIQKRDARLVKKRRRLARKARRVAPRKKRDAPGTVYRGKLAKRDKIPRNLRRFGRGSKTRAVYYERNLPPNPLAAKLCDALHRHAKVRRKACCKESFVRPNFAKECTRVLTAAIHTKGVLLDKAGAARCIADVKKQHEGCDWVGFFPPQPPKSCFFIIKGLVAPGKRCRSSLECKGKNSCYGLSATRPGVCYRPRKKGQPCGTVVDPLGAVTRQNDLDRQRPRCEGYCLRGRCADRAAKVGTKCHADRQCGPGMHCASDKCAKGEHAKIGKPCASQCEKGARCYKRKCIKVKKLGEACTVEEECRAGCLIPKGKKKGVCGVQCEILRGYSRLHKK